MTVHLAIRGFRKSVKVFEHRVTREESALVQLLPELAGAHALAMKSGELGMIEIEFLDEPNPLERFFRIGVDPSGMVRPIAIETEEVN